MTAMKRGVMILGAAAALGCDQPGDGGGGGTFTAPPDTTALDTGGSADTGGAPDLGADDTGASADTAPSMDIETVAPAPDADDGVASPRAAAVCARWNADRADLREGAWTGSASACDAGAYLDPGPSHTLKQVNLYRFLADLPEVASDVDMDAEAQACALLMHANRTIDHTVPSSWTCYEPVGAAAAAVSNLATTAGVEAVDLYMTDQDVDNLGHRRWLLSNSLGPIGIGSTSSYSCLLVLSGRGDARARWVAWPPPGAIPFEAVRLASWMDTDAAGWSVQSDYIDLRRGAVVVTRDGAELPVDVWQLDPGYGSSFGLGIRPRGWRTEADATYTVTVSGLSEPITWTFTAVDCD